MKYSAVLFDYDYTLGNSEKGIFLCAREALEKMGIGPVPDERVKMTIGYTLTESYRMLTEDSSPVRAELYKRYFIEAADRNMTDVAVMYPYSIPFILALRSEGIRTGVVTTKYCRRITEILDKYGVPEIMDVIVGSDAVPNPKPAPDSIFLASNELDVPLSRILYVGDSTVDAKTAQSAGVDFAAVLTGNTTEDEFASYPNVGVFQDLTSLYALLDLEEEHRN